MEKEKEDLNQKTVNEEEKKPKPPEPYTMFGSDKVITAPDFITYAKYRMKMMIMKYKLVGTVNNKGQYIISDDIKKDLVKMEKEIADSDDTYFKAIALYMKKHFHYVVKIEQLEDGRARASLFLAEWVDDYLGNEYIYTHIADFTDVNDENFLNKVRKVYHLVNVNVKVDDFAVPELAVRMQEIFDLNFVEGALYDMACQIYLTGLVQLLEKGGPECKELLAEYRRLLAQRNVDPNDKFKYISYKSILDRLIDEKGGLNSLGLDPKEVSRIVNEMNRTLLQIDSASKRGPLEVLTSPSEDKDLKTMVKGKSSAPKTAAPKSSDKKIAGKKSPQKKVEEKKPTSEHENDLFDIPNIDIAKDVGHMIDSILGTMAGAAIGMAMGAATGSVMGAAVGAMTGAATATVETAKNFIETHQPKVHEDEKNIDFNSYLNLDVNQNLNQEIQRERRDELTAGQKQASKSQSQSQLLEPENEIPLGRI